MKNKVEIEINKPLNRVIELFDNPENMKYWYPGFVSFEPMSGQIGQEGAKSKVKYKSKNKIIEIIQTITKRNLPGELWGTYESNGIWYEVKNSFIELDSGKTKWESITEVRLSGIMKLISIFMSRMFKKQAYKHLMFFKKFAEAQA